MKPNNEWDERMELTQRRCAEIIDLDVEPPVKYISIRCKVALKEIKELDKLHSKTLQQQREEIISEIEGIVKENRKGTFTDEGGNDCWYIDDLVKELKVLEKK